MQGGGWGDKAQVFHQQYDIRAFDEAVETPYFSV